MPPRPHREPCADRAYVQRILLGTLGVGCQEARAQLAARVSCTHGISAVTRAYTAGVDVEHVLLPQDTMPARVQTPSFWQTRGPPESPCRRRQDLCPSRKEGARALLCLDLAKSGGADQGQVGAQRLCTDTRTCSDGSSAPYSWGAWGGG